MGHPVYFQATGNFLNSKQKQQNIKIKTSRSNMETDYFSIIERHILGLSIFPILQTLFPTWALGLFNQQKLIRGQVRNSGKSLMRLKLQQEGAKTSNRCSCLLPACGVGGRRAGSGHKGGLRWSALMVLCAGIMLSILILLLAPQKWQLVCGLFVSYCS